MVRLAAQPFSAWLSSQCCIDAMHGCSSITCPHHACELGAAGAGAQDLSGDSEMWDGRQHDGRHGIHPTLRSETARHDRD